VVLSASQSHPDDPTRSPFSVLFFFFGSGSACGSRALAVLLIPFILLACLLQHTHLLISRLTPWRRFLLSPSTVSPRISHTRSNRHPRHFDEPCSSSLAAGQEISHHGFHVKGNLHQDHKRAARQCQSESVDSDGERHTQKVPRSPPGQPPGQTLPTAGPAPTDPTCPPPTSPNKSHSRFGIKSPRQHTTSGLLDCVQRKYCSVESNPSAEPGVLRTHEVSLIQHFPVAVLGGARFDREGPGTGWLVESRANARNGTVCRISHCFLCSTCCRQATLLDRGR
jgi:hypothetical protein